MNMCMTPLHAAIINKRNINQTVSFQLLHILSCSFLFSLNLNTAFKLGLTTWLMSISYATLTKWSYEIKYFSIVTFEMVNGSCAFWSVVVKALAGGLVMKNTLLLGNVTDWMASVCIVWSALDAERCGTPNHQRHLLPLHQPNVTDYRSLYWKHRLIEWNNHLSFVLN